MKLSIIRRSFPRVKAIYGYENHYAIQEDGKVLSLDRRIKMKNGFRSVRKRVLHQVVNNRGYATVELSKYGIRRRKLVHRVLAEAFIPNPKKKSQVNHKNGRKIDNRLQNLEWSTSSENMLHASKMGLLKRKGGRLRQIGAMSKMAA